MQLKVEVSLERMVIAELHRERSLLGDTDLATTLARRIEVGLDLISRAAHVELDWRPISSRAEPVHLELPDSLDLDLQAACAEVGFDRDVLLATFAGSDVCRPDEIVLLDAITRTNRPIFQKDTYIRTEVGRGHIYKAHFDLPGFQLAFIRLAGQGTFTRGEVVGEALLALAREATVTGLIGGLPVTEEAFALAEKMVSYAERWPAQKTNRE